ncbi:hypothetical protein OG897_25095 [Streptomyces sp. NBC_00237]|uniref:hypothetical protein n=1 Tax=Streptomyces sp. NBC_00237 TaxID=2975687 RepID=UPI0022500352|nr:hypothetical protein [Streptomyces sp. NBC_00237]MCX5204719.1 hypothetical protein [Streptomyces sp. NBC_00237]
MIAAVGATVAGAAVLVAPGIAQADSSAVPAASQVKIQGKYYFNTWRNAYSYEGRNVNTPKKGILWAGRNYFYCQAQGQDHHDDAGNKNTWWAKTDDDNGNRNVWVSATAFSVGGNYEPIPGLPKC